MVVALMHMERCRVAQRQRRRVPSGLRRCILPPCQHPGPRPSHPHEKHVRRRRWRAISRTAATPHDRRICVVK